MSEVEPLAITVVTIAKCGPSCRRCGGTRFGSAGSRLHCQQCGERRQVSRGALHVHRVLVDPPAWPLESTVVDSVTYDRLRGGAVFAA